MAADESQSDDDSNRETDSLEPERRDDDERWTYATSCNYGDIQSSLLRGDLVPENGAIDGRIRLKSVHKCGIPLDVMIGNDHGSVGVLVHLSAEQAEALAEDLLSLAEIARDRTSG